MKRLILSALCAALALAMPEPRYPTPGTVEPGPAITYELTPHLTDIGPRLDIALHITTGANADSVSVQMPTWSPGDYHTQNFAQFVQNVQAWNGSPQDAHPLAVTHPDAQTWKVVTHGAKTITLTYALPQEPPGFFSENVELRERQVFVNGPAAYLYVVGRKAERVGLSVALPDDWRAEMPLPTTETNDAHRAAFAAPDYDTLADSPLLLAPRSDVQTIDFTRGGKPHRALFFGAAKNLHNVQAMQPILEKIAAAESRIMGGMPYERYEWFFDVNGRGGGLEHLNSSRLSLFASRGNVSISPAFVAHEFFHLWNVKRIRPRVLGPFDYLTPPKTPSLWFAEGVTEYYAHIATRRAGLSTEAAFLSHWRTATGRAAHNPEYGKVTADESSLRVWEAGNSEGYGISYYDKGELIGLCLDLKIRHVTHNQRSLDDVMRLLLKQFGLPRPGYEEDELRATINEIAGQNLSPFFDALARSTDPLPFAECFGYAGLDANLNPLPNATDAQIALRRAWAAADK